MCFQRNSQNHRLTKTLHSVRRIDILTDVVLFALYQSSILSFLITDYQARLHPGGSGSGDDNDNDDDDDDDDDDNDIKGEGSGAVVDGVEQKEIFIPIEELERREKEGLITSQAEISGDESSDDESNGDESSGDEASDDESSGDEASDDESSDDESSDDESSDDESSGDESSDDESSGDESHNELESDNFIPVDEERTSEQSGENEVSFARL